MEADKHVFYVADYPGSNDDERISACLKDASAYDAPTVVFAGRDFVITQAILVSSKMTILVDDCTIRQADLTFDNVFRGANIHLDPDNFGYVQSIDPQEHVRILGRGKAMIEGCTVNRRGYHPVMEEEQDMVGDYWGFFTHQVLMLRTAHLEIAGLTFVKTRGWCITLEYCTQLHIHDLEIYSTVKNGDGIHLFSGCHDGVVERISGVTSDDTVAINPGFAATTYPHGRMLLPSLPSLCVAGDWQTDMDCYNITVRDIRAGGQMHNVMCLALNGTCVHDVLIENVTDTCRGELYMATVFLYTGVYGEPGCLRDIQVKNIDSLADTCLVVNTNIDNLLISGLHSRTQRKRLLGTYPKVY